MKKPSINILDVCFGIVFKLDYEGKTVVALSPRMPDGSLDVPREITAHTERFDNMRDSDVFGGIVEIHGKDYVFAQKYKFKLRVDGQLGSASDAVGEGVLAELADTALKSFLARTGPHAVCPTKFRVKYALTDYDPLRKAFEREMNEGLSFLEIALMKSHVKEFNEFIDQIKPGDTLYWYDSGYEDGYAIVRNDRAIKAYTTADFKQHAN